jgi:hypothetical protein
MAEGLHTGSFPLQTAVIQHLAAFVSSAVKGTNPAHGRGCDALPESMGARGRAKQVAQPVTAGSPLDPHGRFLVIGRREGRGHYRTSRGNYDDQIGKNHGS